jgi:hypothetical protein
MGSILLTNFLVCNMLLLVIGMVFYIRSLELIYFAYMKFYIL